MTVAAIYARFSSDSQRDESIEIQVEACSAHAAKRGWKLGEVYADYAMSGTTDERPAFQRAVRDGEAGLYDVLLVLKNDRFARNLEVARRYKRRLKAAGRRFVSVREGESDDTPASFLHEAMDDAFAEYYSRNLSVLIKDGIAKNAEGCKVSGRRMFGYRTGADGRYEVDEAEGAAVREIFARYAAGQSVNDIERWARAEGVRSVRGNPLSRHAVIKMLANDAYAGVYRYAGTVVDGGMPAIVEREVFDMVQSMMGSKKVGAARGDYLLTGKLRCLRCGRALTGSSGTAKSGRRYRYYACASKAGNCNLRMPAGRIEDAVVGEVKAMLADESSVLAMVEAVVEHAESLPDRTEELAAERDAALKRRANLVESIAEGVPAAAVRDAILECEERLRELDAAIARERFNREKLADEADVRAYIERFVDRADFDPRRARLLLDTFVEAVYADGERAVVFFAFGDDEWVPTLDEALSLVESEHPREDPEGVRASVLWWSAVTPARTLYHRGARFALVVALS